MSKVTQIKAYNADLAERLIKIDTNDYFKYIHDNFYPNQDVSFMDYFLELINSDDAFCVDHSKLNDYKVINTKQSSDIKVCLNQYNLVEGEDYLLRNVPESRSINQHGGSNRNKKQYILTPDAFKICLMRAKNSLVYANYYLLHEKNFKHYTDYRLLYDEKLISMKDDNINRLESKMNEQKDIMNEQNDKIDRLLTFANQAVNERNEIKITLEDTKEELGEKLDVALDYLKEKSFTSTMNPVNESKHHCVCAILTKSNHYTKQVKFVSGQQNYVDGQIKKAIGNGQKIIIPKFYNANGIDLRNNARSKFINMRKEYIKLFNERSIKETNDKNILLKAAISTYNKGKARTSRRLYSNEKLYPTRLSITSISVTFNSLSFTYNYNEYMSFNDILKIIVDVNKITQISPLECETSDSDSDSD